LKWDFGIVRSPCEARSHGNIIGMPQLLRGECYIRLASGHAGVSFQSACL
jgi:hypothetical protein